MPKDAQRSTVAEPNGFLLRLIVTVGIVHVRVYQSGSNSSNSYQERSISSGSAAWGPITPRQ
jgi:hypothetical protein